MVQTVIRWRLTAVMADHGVKVKDFAAAMGERPSTISNLRRSATMPKIDGDRLNQLCTVLTRLSSLKEPVTPFDLIHYTPDEVKVEES